MRVLVVSITYIHVGFKDLREHCEAVTLTFVRFATFATLNARELAFLSIESMSVGEKHSQASANYMRGKKKKQNEEM